MRKLLDNQDTGRALFLKLDGYVDDVWVYSTKDPMTISVDICLSSSHEEEYLDRAIKEIVKRVTEKNPDLEVVGAFATSIDENGFVTLQDQRAQGEAEESED